MFGKCATEKCKMPASRLRAIGDVWLCDLCWQQLNLMSGDDDARIQAGGASGEQQRGDAVN